MKKMLIPPRRLKKTSGSFSWPARPLLASPRSADALPLNQLAAELKRAGLSRARVAFSAAGPADVRVRRDASLTSPEHYRLSIRPTGIIVDAGHDAGVYYAIQTLRELVRLHGRRLPCCDIADHPDFTRRGVYLDCSRGKVPTVDTLKSLVEYLGRLKINELQLYIENVFTFRAHPKIGRGFSPYTPEELLEVQEHCKRHHLRFVPSLTSFGHFEKILALPEYRHLGEMPGNWGYPGGTTLCPGDPASIRLVSDMYDEFLPLFEAVDFNACCDETWELGKGRSKRRADRAGTGKIYLDFIRKLHRLCDRHGKRMNIWSDIVLNHPEFIPEVPKDVVMLNWDYAPNGSRIPQSRRFPEAGLPFIACPGTSAWQSHGTRLQSAIDNVSVFARTARRYGAEGMLNTDWGDCGHRNTLGVSLHGYAHGAAHAWNGRAVDDATFTRTYCFHALGQADDRLAGVLRALGDTETATGPRYPYHVWGDALSGRHNLYRGIRPGFPAWFPEQHRPPCIDQASEKGCHRVIERLGDPASWTSFGATMEPFAKKALADIILAGRMDTLACRRLLAGKAVRADNKADTRALAADTRRLAKAFEKNWLARNKPSRLTDNLRLLQNAANE